MNYSRLLRELLTIEIEIRILHIETLIGDESSSKKVYISNARRVLEENLNLYVNIVDADRSWNESKDLVNENKYTINSPSFVSYASTINDDRFKDFWKENTKRLRQAGKYLSPMQIRLYQALFNETFSFHESGDINTHLISFKRAATIHELVLGGVKSQDSIQFSNCNFGVGDQLFFAPLIGEKIGKKIIRDDVRRTLERLNIKYLVSDRVDKLDFIDIEEYGYQFDGIMIKKYFLWASDILNLGLILNLFMNEEQATKKVAKIWINRRKKKQTQERQAKKWRRLVLDLNSSPTKASVNNLSELKRICNKAIDEFEELIVIMRNEANANLMKTSFKNNNSINIINTKELDKTIIHHLGTKDTLSICVAGASGMGAIMGDSRLIIYSGKTNSKWDAIQELAEKCINKDCELNIGLITMSEIQNEGEFSNRIIKDILEVVK